MWWTINVWPEELCIRALHQLVSNWVAEDDGAPWNLFCSRSMSSSSVTLTGFVLILTWSVWMLFFLYAVWRGWGEWYRGDDLGGQLDRRCCSWSSSITSAIDLVATCEDINWNVFSDGYQHTERRHTIHEARQRGSLLSPLTRHLCFVAAPTQPFTQHDRLFSGNWIRRIEDRNLVSRMTTLQKEHWIIGDGSNWVSSRGRL